MRIRYQEHKPCSVGFKLISSFPQLQMPYESYFGVDCTEMFLKLLVEIEQRCMFFLFDDQRMIMTSKNDTDHAAATVCSICAKQFDETKRALKKVFREPPVVTLRSWNDCSLLPNLGDGNNNNITVNRCEIMTISPVSVVEPHMRAAIFNSEKHTRYRSSSITSASTMHTSSSMDWRSSRMQSWGLLDRFLNAI